MSLLAFRSIDDPKLLPLLYRPRWRYGIAIIVAYIIMLLGTIFSERLTLTAVGSSIVETTNYAIPVGIFCWIAWFREKYALRRAIAIMLIWSLTSVAVNVLTKWGMTEHFLTNGSANSWSLLGGSLFIVPPLILLFISRRSDAMYSHGIRWTHFRWQIAVGCLAGTVIGVHFLSTVRFSGVTSLSFKPMPYLIWTFSYEVFQSFGEEIFFRGLIYRALQNVYKLNAWQATGITILANAVPFLMRANWREPLLLAGLIIYLTMYATANCMLFRRYQSILPGFIVNLVFSFTSVLR